MGGVPMEVVGSVAATTQILEQAVRGTFACIEFYKKCKEAPQVAREQQATIQTLQSILNKISDERSIQTEEVLASVDGCSTVLQKINTILEKALQGIDESNTKKVRKRISGAANDGKMRRLFESLEGAKSSLILSIGVITASVCRTASLTQHHEVAEVPRRQDVSVFDVPLQNVSRFFVGRRIMLDRLQRLLNRNECAITTDTSMARIVVLRALGGQGKTQLALRLCQQLRTEGLFAILWVDASSENSVRSAYFKQAQMMQSQLGDENSDDMEYNITYIMRKLGQSTKGYLLVMDNFDQPDGYYMQKYIPDNARGAILITSRHNDAGALVTDPSTEDIPLEGLDPCDAVSLLCHASRIDRGKQNEQYCAEVAERLAYHPLTISQAGVYIKKRNIQISQFVPHYERKKAEILQLVTTLSPYRRTIAGTEEESAISVFTTWELSFQHMCGDAIDLATTTIRAQDCPTAHDHERRLLTTSAFLGRGEIAEETFAGYNPREDDIPPPHTRLDDWLACFGHGKDSGWDHDAFGSCLALLSDFALLESYHEYDGQYRFCLHALVRDWLRARYSIEVQRSYAGDALCLVGHTVRRCFDTRTSNYRTTKEKHQMVMRHINSVEENARDFDADCQNPRMRIFPGGSTQSGLKEIMAEVFRLRTRTLLTGAGDPMIVTKQLTPGDQTSIDGEIDVHTKSLYMIRMLHFCGIYCTTIYEMDLAMALAKRMMLKSGLEGLDADVDSPQCSSLKVALTQVGQVFLQIDEFALSEATARLLILLYNKQGPPYDFERTHAYHLLGLALEHQELYEQAVHAYEEVCEQTTKDRGEEHRMNISSKGSIAICLAYLDRRDVAERMFAEVLLLSRRVLGIQNAFTMNFEIKMVNQLMTWGKVEEALYMQREIVANMAAVFGEHCPDTITVMKDLRHMLMFIGNVTEAKHLSDYIESLQQGRSEQSSAGLQDACLTRRSNV